MTQLNGTLFPSFDTVNASSAIRAENAARALQAAALVDFVWSIGHDLWTSLATLTAKVRERRDHYLAIAELNGMDDRLLTDIGISRNDIDAAVAGEVRRGRRSVANENLTSVEPAANSNTPRFAA